MTKLNLVADINEVQNVLHCHALSCT